MSQGYLRFASRLLLTIAPAITLLGSASLAQAQIPRDNQPPSTLPIPEPKAPEKIPAPADLIPKTPTQPPTDSAPVDAPPTIQVEKFVVTGSTVFSQAEFDAVTAPYVGRMISVAELFQARSAITQLYVEKGYITSGALIPPQKLKSGIVEIQIIEGKLETINVTGIKRLRPGYVSSRVGLATQTPLNRNKLLESLRLLQLDPLIQNLSAELSAGTRPGESLLDLKVTEARTLDFKMTFDNNRSPSVGSSRRRLQLSEANLFGFGDAVTVGYTNTNGSNSVDLGYTIPLSPRNTTLSLNIGASSSNVIERPFNVLNIQSRSSYYEFTLRHPFKQTPSEEFAMGVTGSFRQSGANFLDDQVPFPAVGVDSEGKTRVSSLRFFQEWTKRSEQQVLAARSQFSFGVDALGSSIVKNGSEPDSRFFTWRGQGQWVRLLAPDTLLLVRGDVQLADRGLLGLEQFGLGGQETVRGYRQDALLADGGLLFSVEGRIPLVKFGAQKKNILHLTPFFELGRGWNVGARPDPVTQTLVSTGLGLRLQLSDKLTARLDWGIPLNRIDGDKRSWQENGVYFSIVGSPF
jgi:hemolysin activation/secretion protein